MEKLRIRGGDFIGIVIPGAILLLNVYLIFSSSLTNRLTAALGEHPFTVNQDVVAFLFFLIIAYVAGVVLRLLSPDIPDKWSVAIRVLASLRKIGINKARRIQGRDSGHYHPLRGFYQDYPYFKWFLENTQKSMPDISAFYEANFAKYANLQAEKPLLSLGTLFTVFPVLVLTVVGLFTRLSVAALASVAAFILVYLVLLVLGYRETRKRHDLTDAYPNRLDWKDFLNCCKLVVLKRCPALGEEILFAEGLSRMVSGSFYAIAMSLVVLIVHQSTMRGSMVTALGYLFGLGEPRSILFMVNLALLAIVTWGTHHVRVKEAVTVFSAYGIVMTDPPDGGSPGTNASKG